MASDVNCIYTRFWYERREQFTQDQLDQLKKSSLSRIICDNSDSIGVVPESAFILQSVNEFVDCNEIPQVNLNLWTEY